MLTEKQYNLLAYINKINKETGQCPSFDEMKDAIGLRSKSGIHNLINSLAERGFLRKIPHKARALEVIRLPKFKPQAVIEEENKRDEAARNGAVHIHYYRGIAAGLPTDETTGENESVCVPYEMVANGKFYALKIIGDSMIDAGILDGDTAIIREQNQARNGQIAVALINNETTTLKKIKKDGEYINLIPCNKKFEVQRYLAGNVKIQGILSSIIRKY
ncbi:MAG: transcriptional repressor LexA [Alphaproteobacteria bacterium]|nr:transcriptional repressor LexA [Alphaproteobacteria bacterium]